MLKPLLNSKFHLVHFNLSFPLIATKTRRHKVVLINHLESLCLYGNIKKFG